MVLYWCFLVLVVKEHAAAIVSDDQVPAHLPSKPLHIGDLAQLIHRISEDTTRQEVEATSRQAIDLDYFSTDDTHRAVLSTIIRLLKKNQVGPQNKESGVRIHVIKNPEVLEEYKESLRKRRRNFFSRPKNPEDEPTEELSDLSALAGSDYANNDEKSKENWNYKRKGKHLLRRNAVFRLDEKSGETKRSSNSRHNKKGHHQQISSENTKIVHFESRGDKNNRDDNKSENDRKDSDKTKNKDNHKRADTDKDSWDTITKQWDISDVKDHGSDKHKNDKETKSNKGSNEDWDKPNLSKVTKWDTWSKPKSSERENKKYDDEKSNQKDVAKAKSIRESSEREKSKKDWKGKEIKSNEHKMKDEGKHDDYKEKDDWKSKKHDDYKDKDDWKQKKHDNYKDKDDWKPKKHDNYKDKDDWKPKKHDDYKDKNDWKPKKHDDFKEKDDWKPKKRDDFKEKDDWKPKKHDDYKAKDNWKPKKHDDFKEKDDWKIDSVKETTYGMPTYKTTKDRSGRGSNKKFVPVIPEFHPPISRPRNQNSERNLPFKAFGRTSIPFVGKKGIYEE